MPDSKRTYQNLLQQGFSKQEIDGVLHKLTLLRLKEKKEHSTRRLFISFFGAKNLQLLKHLSGKGLFLLKTQFAKKPKNPI